MKNKDESSNLPGYPHYPSSEDILNHNAVKVDADPDNMPRNPNAGDLEAAQQKMEGVRGPAGDPDPKTETNLTKDDLTALGDENLGMDMNDEDEILRNRMYPVDMAASDLDIPGAELDDENEIIGEEDEENNFYSLGGDEHD